MADDCIQQKSKILRNQKSSSATNVVSEHTSEACIFCKIVKGEILCAKVYEDDEILSFLDIMPSNKGHLLVIPKQHFETFTDIPAETAGSMAVVAQNLAKAVKRATGCDGYNVLMNTGKAAGQVVMHAHLHIMPKFESDGWKFEWPQEKYKEKEIDEWRENIKNSL